MHEDDAELRATLARVVLTDLRTGRPQLTPAARAALRLLTAELDETEPEETLPSAADDERARNPRRVGAALGVAVAVAALAGGLVLAGTRSPSTRPTPPAVAAAATSAGTAPTSAAASTSAGTAPTSVATPAAAPPAPATVSTPPATPSAGTGTVRSQPRPPRRPGQPPVHPGTATRARPALDDARTAGPVPSNVPPPRARQAPATAAPTPSATPPASPAASAAPSSAQPTCPGAEPDGTASHERAAAATVAP
jgi:hypothetical protein